MARRETPLIIPRVMFSRASLTFSNSLLIFSFYSLALCSPIISLFNWWNWKEISTDEFIRYFYGKVVCFTDGLNGCQFYLPDSAKWNHEEWERDVEANSARDLSLINPLMTNSARPLNAVRECLIPGGGTLSRIVIPEPTCGWRLLQACGFYDVLLTDK